MTIEFIVTVDDFIAFNLFHQKNSPTFQRQILMIRSFFAFILAAMLFAGCSGFSDMFSFFTYVIPVAVGVIMFLVYPILHRQEIQKQIRKMLREGTNNGLIGKQKIIIAQEAVINETPAGEQKAFWSTVDKIIETNNYIFLYVSSISASIIPRSAFTSNEQINSFLELAKNYYHASTGKELPIVSSKL